MEAIIDKVMQTFGMMNTLTVEQAEDARLALAEFFLKNPREDDHQATVEGLTFLRRRAT